MTAAAKPAPSPQPEVKQRLRLWIRLLRATRAIEAQVRDRLRVQFAMTLPQFDVMAALYREERGMSMTELSRRLMVSNGNVTGIIDRLVAEAYVLRQALAEDRRSFIVRLTPKGAARFATVAEAHEQWVDQLLSDFDAEEMEMLIGHFDGLAERIRKGGTKP
jgi:DNA-binding MarR family transcriptional regulator